MNGDKWSGYFVCWCKHCKPRNTKERTWFKRWLGKKRRKEDKAIVRKETGGREA